jgi:putative DNA methylase
MTMRSDSSSDGKPPPSWKSRRDAFLRSHSPSKGGEFHWHSRGYLPHFDQSHIIQSITIRLGDALPAALLLKWRHELSQLPAEKCELELRIRIEDHLDAGHGACWLGRPEIGRLVENALFFFDASRYHLLAWCVMPNHAHIVVETLPRWEVGQLAHSWKSYTGNEANKLLGRRGSFWQREYFDRAVRDGPHFESLVRYVENNPVKAGLVSTAEAWPFSSARFPRRMPSGPLFESW